MKADRKMSDEELLKAAKAGDGDAVTVLMERYKGLVKSRVKGRPVFSGGDADDLLQEGMIGLWKAIMNYDPSRGGAASFTTFACTCIDNKIRDALRKYGLINEIAYSYEELVNVTDESVRVFDGGDDGLQESFDAFEKTLSKREDEVFRLMLQGMKAGEISKSLGISYKAADNARTRIREKFKAARRAESADK